MAALTWRNVDTPDFRPSMEGFRLASDTINAAFNRAQAGLKRYDGELDSRANTAVNLNLLKYADPVALQAAIQDGSVLSGQDPRRISAATIQAISARPGDLIAQAINKENLDWTSSQHKRTAGIQAAGDAAAPIAMQIQQLEQSGDREGAAKLRAANPNLGAGLGLDASLALGNSLFGARKGAVELRGSELNNDQTSQNIQQSGARFGREQLDWKTQDEVDAARALIDQNGGFDTDSRLQMIRSLQDKLSPRAYNALVSEYSAGGGSPAGSLIAGAAGGGGGGSLPGGIDPTRIITQGGAGNLGIPALPDSVQNLGQAVEFGKNLNRRGQASSAMGVYQITQETMSEFAPKVFGQGWASRPMDFASQDAVAQKIFESTGGNAKALKGRWTSLNKYSDAEVSQLARQGWGAIRGVISQGESGIDANKLNLPNDLADVGQKASFMERNTGSLATDFEKASTDTRKAPALAAELAKTYSGLGNEGYFLQLINQTASKSGLSPALAAAAIEQSIDANGGSRLRSWINNNIGNIYPLSSKNGQFINQDKLDQTIKEYTSGATQEKALTNRNATQQAALRAQYAGMAQAAVQRLQRAEYAVANQGAKINLEPLRAQARFYQSMAEGTAQRQIQDPSVTTFRTPNIQAPAQKSGNGGGSRPANNQTALSSAGNTMLEQARAARSAEGSKKIVLNDQFERAYGMSPASAIISHYSTMVQAAQGAKRMGGVVGEQLRREFTAQYKMSPSEAIARYAGRL